MVFKSTYMERCMGIEHPVELSFVTAGILVLLALIIIPGNILIILAVVLDPNKNLRTPFNWLVVNLATADLLVGIFQPLSVHYHIKEGLKKEITPEEANAAYILYLIPCTLSVLSLLSLAIERYFAVSKPVRYRSKMNNKRIFLMIVAIWLISLSLPNLCLEISFTMYAFIFSNITVTVAVIIIFVTYTFTKKFKNASSSKANKATFSFPSRQLAAKNTIVNSRILLEVKFTEMFLVIVFALFCCFGSSTILIYLVHFCRVCSCTTLQWFRKFNVLLMRLNSSVNVFCYALRSSRFRSSFSKLLRIKRDEDNIISSVRIPETPAVGRIKHDPTVGCHSVQVILPERHESSSL